MSPTPAPTPTPIPAAPATGTLTPLAWADPQRKVLFEAWLADLQGAHQLVAASLRLASADASFRRYLRIDSPLAAPASSSSSWTPHTTRKTASPLCRWRS